MGTAVAMLFLPPPPPPLPPLRGVRKNTFSKFPPPRHSQQHRDFGIVVEMDLRFNVRQLNVVVELHSRATRDEVTNNGKSKQVFIRRRELRSSVVPPLLAD